MKHSRCLLILTALILIPGVDRATAATYTYNLDTAVTGTNEEYDSPILTATFSDITAEPGGFPTVQLTLTSTGLIDRQVATEWYFNLNPDLEPSDLNIQLVSASGPGVAPTISLGDSNAGGGLSFDIMLDLQPAGTSVNDAFGVGSTFIFQITGAPSLDASDFNYISSSAKGDFYTVAHLQNGISNVAPWIGDAASRVPEPGTWAMLGSLLMLVFAVKQRPSRSQPIADSNIP
jgi:hypothetical protein